MTTLDIRGTVVGEVALAVKAPCAVATTGANITLSGVQTIDGVSVGNNSERVLVKDQTTVSQNGIYIASSGAWVLAADFTNNNNVAFGTLVLVTSGNTNAGILFEQTCTDSPIVIGTSLVAFSALSNNTAQAATSTTSLTIGTGAKTLTIQSGKSFVANQYVVIYETSAPATNSMLATVTSYSSTSLVVNVVATTGSGTHTDWSVVLNNSQAGAGIAPPVGSGNVTGPGSSTAGHLATFADGTGKVLQDGGVNTPAASTINASMLLQSAVGFGVNMLNGTLVFSNAGNALIVTVKTLAGNVPSSTDPVWFIFRDATATAGDYVVIEVTAALSTTIPSASTLGSSNATPFRIWVEAINNAGTVSLAVINALSGTNIFPLGGWGIASVTAYGGGANAAQVFYGTGTLSSVPYSVLGYFTYEAGSTLATAGTWNANPSRSELLRPGVPLPGQVVQKLRTSKGTPDSETNAYSISNTAPAPANGKLALSQAITPNSSANILEIDASILVSAAANVVDYVYIYDGTNTDVTAATTIGASGQLQSVPLSYAVLAGTLSALTYSLYFTQGGATTAYLNSQAGVAQLGGTANTYLRVQEIMA